MFRYLKMCMAMIGISALTGCAAPLVTEKYADDQIDQFQKFQAPKNAARVYFLNGVSTGATLVTLRHGFPSVLIGNDVEIGAVNKSDVLVADIRPGNYQFLWKPPAEPDATKSKPLDVNLSAGDILILQGNFFLGGLGFGLLGALAVPPRFELVATTDRNVIKELVFVKPTACPETVCVSE